MEVLTLVDNVVYGEGLIAEHGLSFLIKHNQKTYLFGTGKSGAIVHNASALSEELTDVDYVVISHIYDHLEGLEAFLKVNETATIFLKNREFEGASERQNSVLIRRFESYPNTFVFLKEDLEIEKGVKLIADINVYGHESDSFFTKSNAKLSESAELFMLIEIHGKMVVFTGCSPKGIMNIVKTAYDKGHRKRIHAICGGMHFNGEILHELDEHLTKLSRFGIKKIYTNHCTGIDGYLRMKTTLPATVHYAFTGFHFEID